MATANAPVPDNDNNLSLLIVAKAKMNNGLCYMGYDKNTKRLVRPLYSAAKDRQCWPRVNEFTVGETIVFKVTRRCPEESSLPHRNDDFLVDSKVNWLNPAEPLSPTAMFETLSEFKSSSTVHEIFGNGNNTFVNEATACPSVGIYRCKGEAITIYEVPRDEKPKRRCFISEPSNEYNLSITAEEMYEQPKSDDSVLLLLGLGRPFVKKENRCYIFVIGMVIKPSDSKVD